MWAITPTFSIIIAFISWGVFCWAHIWFFSLPSKDNDFFVTAVFLLIRRIFYVIYTMIGLILLDSIFRILFLHPISYGSFRYIAAPILLCTTVSLIYLFRSAFIAPAWSELLVFLVMAGIYLFLSPSSLLPPWRSPLAAGIVLSTIFTVADLISGRQYHRKKNPESSAKPGFLPPPAWDISQRCSFLFGAALPVILMISLSLELILHLEGLSFFPWLEGLFC